MRLSEVLELPEFKKRDIICVGKCDTGEAVWIVLAHTGEKAFPFPKNRHLVENGSSNPDPNLEQSEIDTILRRFGYLDAISHLP